MFRLTDVAKQLLIINVLFFIATFLHQEGVFTVIDMNSLALFFPKSDYFQPYQIVTHFFMHGGIFHLVINMLVLAMFGSTLEQLWGPKRFLVFYIICALGAALIHTLVNYFQFGIQEHSIIALQGAVEAFNNSPTYEGFVSLLEDNKIIRNSLTAKGQSYLNEIGTNLQNGVAGTTTQAGAVLAELAGSLKPSPNIYPPMVGASGAIFGLLIGFGMLFPNAELYLMFIPIPVKAKYLIPAAILIELFLGFMQFSWDPIAHFAHLGGALFGFLIILYWEKMGMGLK